MIEKLKTFGLIFLQVFMSLLSCALVLVLSWFVIKITMTKLAWMPWYWMFIILIVGLLVCTIILYVLISRFLD